MNAVFLIKIHKETSVQLMRAVSTLCAEETRCNADQKLKRKGILLILV